MTSTLARARRIALAVAALLTVAVGVIALVALRDEPWAASGWSVVIALLALPLLTVTAIALDRRARAAHARPR